MRRLFRGLPTSKAAGRDTGGTGGSSYEEGHRGSGSTGPRSFARGARLVMAERGNPFWWWRSPFLGCAAGQTCTSSEARGKVATEPASSARGRDSNPEFTRMNEVCSYRPSTCSLPRFHPRLSNRTSERQPLSRAVGGRPGGRGQRLLKPTRFGDPGMRGRQAFTFRTAIELFTRRVCSGALARIVLPTRPSNSRVAVLGNPNVRGFDRCGVTEGDPRILSLRHLLLRGEHPRSEKPAGSKRASAP